MSKYEDLAKEILAKIGGVENIYSVVHCMTRLRFTFKDESKIDNTVEKLAGVMGVVRQGGQFQIIIGNAVGKVYEEILKLGDFGEKSQIAKGQIAEPWTISRVLNGILDGLSGTMSPLIPAIIGCGMIQILAFIFKRYDLLDASTVNLISMIGTGGFYFLPVLVAASAAKKFGVNQFLAIAVSAILVLPSFVELLASDQEVTFLGIPVQSAVYRYSVFPALIMTYLMSFIERGVDAITPPITKIILKPMLILLISGAIAMILIGPLAVWIGVGLSTVVYFINDKLGFLATGIMGALWPFLVMTGMHRIFTPTILETIASTGIERMVMPSEIGANLALGGMALGAALKSKNLGIKETGFAAATSAFLAGTTEPALYGIGTRLKKPMIYVAITGFVCGCLAGIIGIGSSAMSSPSFFSMPQFFDYANPENTNFTIFASYGIGILAVVLSCAMTYLLGFKDVEEEIKD